jgi:DNA-binding SARP family transcriptional activator
VGSLGVIDRIGPRLVLSAEVTVDLHEVWESARSLIAGLGPPEKWEDLVNQLGRELLPGWCDEWLTFERDRWDQMRVYALESLAQRFQSEKQYLPALQAALGAIAVDPIRETAHRIVIEIHIAEGNVASAIKRYRDYRTFLQRELKVLPSPQMTQLVRSLTPT